MVTCQKARSFFVLKVVGLWDTMILSNSEYTTIYVHFDIELRYSNFTG